MVSPLNHAWQVTLLSFDSYLAGFCQMSHLGLFFWFDSYLVGFCQMSLILVFVRCLSSWFLSDNSHLGFCQMSLILVFGLTRALRSTFRRVALGDSREDVYGTSTLNSTSSSGSSSSGLETRRRQDRSNLFSMDFYFFTCDSFLLVL